MSKRLQGLIVGILMGALLTGGVAYAKTASEKIDVTYSDISLYVDGVKIIPKDAGGNIVEPFIYKGTTYLPVRAVGNAVGLPVSWDGTTKTVYLGAKPGEKVYLTDVCPPYDGISYSVFTPTAGTSISMGGTKYTNGIKLHWRGGYSLINLDSKYNSMSFVIGRPDEDNIEDTTVNFFVDDVLVKSIEIKGDALPKKYTIPLNYGLHLKIATDDDDVAIMDIVLD